jgi:hypothetical protein
LTGLVRKEGKLSEVARSSDRFGGKEEKLSEVASARFRQVQRKKKEKGCQRPNSNCTADRVLTV